MSFANPYAFFLFLPLVFLIFYNLKWNIRKRSRLFIPTADWIDTRPKLRLITPFRLHVYLRTIALSLGIIALARPQKIHDKHVKTIEAVDLMIAFDLSKSMDAIDMRPNRRTVALNTLSDFIDKRKNDRMGLVLFSGEALLSVPLTTDHALLKNALANSSNRYLQDGTAIGQSLAVSTNHLRHSNAKSRVIVLVTDGDNNMGSVDPLTAAELAKGFGLKIYTIGLGKKGRVAFPTKTLDAFGREIEVYQYLTDAVNEELLTKISETTQGQFFRAEDNQVLEKIFDTIDKLEKTKVEENTYTLVTEKAWIFLILASVFLLLEAFALNTKWRKLP